MRGSESGAATSTATASPLNTRSKGLAAGYRAPFLYAYMSVVHGAEHRAGIGTWQRRGVPCALRNYRDASRPTISPPIAASAIAFQGLSCTKSSVPSVTSL